MAYEHLEKAKMLLNKTDCTCVLCSHDVILTDKRRGIRPLLDLLDSCTDTAGFAAADKVVGKAAAYLYCLLKVERLYAKVISEPALIALQPAGIPTEFDQLVPAIRNRTGDGFCPMESAVWNIGDPQEALSAIRHTLERISK